MTAALQLAIVAAVLAASGIYLVYHLTRRGPACTAHGKGGCSGCGPSLPARVQSPPNLGRVTPLVQLRKPPRS